MTNNKAVNLVKINKTFKTRDVENHVLFDIDQDFKYGEITLLVGPSGCGKTTLISIIGGILNAETGEVYVFDKRIDNLKEKEITKFRRENLGFIFQQHNLIPTLTVKENISIPLKIIGKKDSFINQRADEILEKVNLSDKKNAMPRELSGGQQQRVAIARALIHDPKMVICDEPTASLDGKTGHRVVELLKEVALEEDRAVIIVTHDPRIFEYGDRKLTMDDGKIIADERNFGSEI